MRILGIQLFRIGDITLCLPAIHSLRKAFPQARLEWMITSNAEPILRGNPDVDEILLYDRRPAWAWFVEIRRRRYDLLVDFLANPRTALLAAFSAAKQKAGMTRSWRRIFYDHFQPREGPVYSADHKLHLLKTMGIPTSPGVPRLSVLPEEQEEARRFLALHGLEKPVLLWPYSRTAVRRWRAEGFAEIAQWLKARGTDFAWLSGPAPEERLYVGEVARRARAVHSAAAPVLEISGVRFLLSVLSEARLFVGNDGGPYHLAAAVGTPCVVPFGPTRNFPESDSVAPVRAQVWCLGCGYDACPYDHECMKLLSSREMIAACERWL